MTWFVAGSGVVQLGIAAWATWIGVKALRVSQRVERDAREERDRADARYRLMCIHDLLNGLEPLQQARAADAEVPYADGQRWMRTMLAIAALRHRMPLTAALVDRPFGEGWPGLVGQVAGAREEIHELLELESDRVYSIERLGPS